LLYSSRRQYIPTVDTAWTEEIAHILTALNPETSCISGDRPYKCDERDRYLHTAQLYFAMLHKGINLGEKP